MPAPSPEPSDPKLAQLDGLNLSRAWMLEGIAASLAKSDKPLPAITLAANNHKTAGLAAVTGAHYEGGHWLGSFAVYLVTTRGISGKSKADGDRRDLSERKPKIASAAVTQLRKRPVCPEIPNAVAEHVRSRDKSGVGFFETVRKF